MRAHAERRGFAQLAVGDRVLRTASGQHQRGSAQWTLGRLGLLNRIDLRIARIVAAERVDGSTTVLKDDGDSFGFADLDFVPDPIAFMQGARASIERSRSSTKYAC